MNKKGFVLLETLVVTVFSLFIFSILYNNIVPLLGKFNELSYYNDLDVTYDLYHIRKFLRADSNYAAKIKKENYQIITCNNDTLVNQNICYTVFDALEIETTRDELLFIKKSYINTLKSDNKVSDYVKDYLNYINPSTDILLLQHDGYLSYLNA